MSSDLMRTTSGNTHRLLKMLLKVHGSSPVNFQNDDDVTEVHQVSITQNIAAQLNTDQIPP